MSALVTPTQARVLSLIAGSIRSDGCPPSLHDLRAWTQCASVHSVHETVTRLREKRLLTWGTNNSRTMVPTTNAVTVNAAQCRSCRREVFVDRCHACGCKAVATRKGLSRNPDGRAA